MEEVVTVLIEAYVEPILKVIFNKTQWCNFGCKGLTNSKVTASHAINTFLV